MESKRETEFLQEKVSLLSIQLIDREEKNQKLLEDNQSNWYDGCIGYCHQLHITGLQSQLVEIRAQLDDDKEKLATLSMWHIKPSTEIDL